HQLRGRMDAILVGMGTVIADDPLLTARPPGQRIATRVVFDSRAQLSIDSQLVRTIQQAPLLVFVGPQAAAENIQSLQNKGAEVIQCSRQQSEPCGIRPSTLAVLAELGRRQFTNVLVEG